MPLFGLKNAKRKISSPSSLSSLVLRKTQSTGNIEDSTTLFNNSSSHKVVLRPITPSTETKSILRSPDQKYNTTRPPSSPPLEPTIATLNPVIEEDDTLLASKLRDITACDMELLLSLETQARMDCQEEKEKKQQSMIATATTHRQSTVKFELPITPPRSKSPDPATSTTTTATNANNNNNNNNNLSQQARQRRWSLPEDINKKKSSGGSSRLSRWSKLIKQQQQEEARNNLHRTNSNDTSSSSGSGGSNTEDDALLPFDNLLDEQQRITIGSKVKLFKRPLPIIGTVKYLGKVHFDTGDWLGIELDSRVGNTDGKVDGHRYFQTNLHCGIFVKKEDAIKV